MVTNPKVLDIVALETMIPIARKTMILMILKVNNNTEEPEGMVRTPKEDVVVITLAHNAKSLLVLTIPTSNSMVSSLTSESALNVAMSTN